MDIQETGNRVGTQIRYGPGYPAGSVRDSREGQKSMMNLVAPHHVVPVTLVTEVRATDSLTKVRGMQA